MIFGVFFLRGPQPGEILWMAVWTRCFGPPLALPNRLRSTHQHRVASIQNSCLNSVNKIPGRGDRRMIRMPRWD
jgi:hypothetical protein